MRHIKILFLLLFSNNAYAVLGAGDIVWDPKLEAQVIALYQQTVELYDNAKDHLKTAAEINQTIYEAEQAYDAIVNFNLKKAANEMFGFNSSQGASGRWKMQGLLNDLNVMENTGKNTGRFYDYQLGRLENMKAMFEFQEAAVENIEEASTDIPQRQSTQITAQSTASMAALMAAEDLRRQNEEAENAAAMKRDSDAFFKSKHIYRGFSNQAAR